MLYASHFILAGITGNLFIFHTKPSGNRNIGRSNIKPGNDALINDMDLCNG